MYLREQGLSGWAIFVQDCSAFRETTFALSSHTSSRIIVHLYVEIYIGQKTDISMVRVGPMESDDHGTASLWLARALIGTVLLWNVQCALAFLIQPGAYVAAFELHGVAGEAMLRGVGLLFLMWNVPYAVACWQPRRHGLSLWEAIAMQAIGLGGEMALRWGLPAGHEILSASLGRFVLFDAAGLGLLLLAALVVGKREGESTRRGRRGTESTEKGRDL